MAVGERISVARDRWPNFHDGNVTGVDLVAEKQVKISVSSLDADQYVFTLEGVSHLKCNDFREGNIIFEIQVFTEEEPDLDLMRSLFDLDAKEHPTFLLEFCNKVLRGILKLFYIRPSYGCELIALCTSATLEIKQKHSLPCR